jgi:hypothetical protein
MHGIYAYAMLCYLDIQYHYYYVIDLFMLS